MIRTTKNIEKADVITHSGTFHGDDVLATVILNRALGDITVYRAIEVPQDVDENVIVYDIGFGKFDHHQEGEDRKRENGVPYAACGLIWKEFGKKIVANTLNPELVWNIIDKELIQPVDAVDNGVMPTVMYPTQPMHFSKIISKFNPSWEGVKSYDVAFENAVVFAGIVFDYVLADAISRAKAQKIVEKAIELSRGHIMVLSQNVPWNDVVLSSTNKKAMEIQFVVYPSKRGGYNWRCVSSSIGDFRQRKNVPLEWRGLHGKALQKVTGVKTARFCHPKGFIGGAETLEDAIKMAKIAVDA